MRKIFLFGLGLAAVFAFSAVAATSAFAEEALWLYNGADICTGCQLLVEILGLLFLSDSNTPGGVRVEVHCVGAFDGWLGAGGTDEVTEVLDEHNELNAGLIEDGVVQDLVETCDFVLAGPCQTAHPPDVETDGLPWETLLTLEGTIFDDLLTGNLGGELGFKVTCLTILGSTEDLCSTPTSLAEIMMEPTSLVGLFNEIETATCTLGGPKSGSVVGEGLFEHPEGGTLTVDSL
jgi:hypothetical protein